MQESKRLVNTMIEGRCIEYDDLPPCPRHMYFPAVRANYQAHLDEISYLSRLASMSRWQHCFRLVRGFGLVLYPIALVRLRIRSTEGSVPGETTWKVQDVQEQY